MSCLLNNKWTEGHFSVHSKWLNSGSMLSFQQVSWRLPSSLEAHPTPTAGVLLTYRWPGVWQGSQWGCFVGSGCCQHPLWSSCQACPRPSHSTLPASTGDPAALRTQCPAVGCPQLIIVSDGGSTAQRLQPRLVAVLGYQAATQETHMDRRLTASDCGQKPDPTLAKDCRTGLQEPPTLLPSGPGMLPRQPCAATETERTWRSQLHSRVRVAEACNRKM